MAFQRSARLARLGFRVGVLLVLAQPAAASAFGVEETVLDDGMRVWTQRTPGTGRASIRVLVRAGSGDEESGPSGVAHLLEHVLFDRVEDRALDALLDALEQEGGDLNAFTTVDSTYASIEVFAEDLDAALALTARHLELPPLDARALRQHRKVVTHELDENPDDALFLSLLEHLYGDHAIARPEGGRLDDIDRIGAGDLERFYALHYHPERVVVILVADAPRERLLESARRHLSTVRWPAAPSEPLTPAPPERAAGPIALSDEDYGGTILHGVAAPDARDPAYPAMWLLQEMLDSHLYEQGRDQRGLSYGPYVYLTPGRFEGLLYLHAYADEGDLEALAGLFDEELGRIARGAFDDAEFEHARHRIERRAAREHAEPAALADYLAWLAGVLEPGDPVVAPDALLDTVTHQQLVDTARRLDVDARRFDLRSIAIDEADDDDARGAPVAGTPFLLAGLSLVIALQIAILARLRRSREGAPR